MSLKKTNAALMFKLDQDPPQPDDADWTFVDDLQKPMWQRHPWRPRQAARDEVDLRGGVRVEAGFPDPDGVLHTAYADLDVFLLAGQVPTQGTYRITTAKAPMPIAEAYEIHVESTACRVIAADTEGIRRGLFYIEDEMLRREGPFLPQGVIRRRPVIRTRISRCFFGPIKRPPRYRDELTDDRDYYPDHYLSRLAHDGVNGLWLTVSWKDLCRTDIIPEYGRDADRRLAKLRRTVSQCRRYGIGVYLFCIEPAAVNADDPLAHKYRHLFGHVSNNTHYFCPSRPLVKRYIRESVSFLFREVPHLGGLIAISVGERATHCHSSSLEVPNTCPRCRRRTPQTVLGEVLTAMREGIRDAGSNGELISWPYSQFGCWGYDETVKAAGEVPPAVILQQNFESGGSIVQLGKRRDVADYSLAFVGPSPIFRDCARRAADNGTRMFAKLQVGCSHEVATVPWVPVPGNLFDKYRAMRRLKVSGAMQCWYFGNYPSLMTRAAGELSFAPLTSSKSGFLTELARRDWGEHASVVAQAWAHFEEGYRQYPFVQACVHYNPVSDGPVWPLYLVPRDLPIVPPWLLHVRPPRKDRQGRLIQYPPSGDRIGEVVSRSHTFQEAITLFGCLADEWEKGVSLLKGLRRKVSDQPERILEIGVAAALGIQFRSGVNILKFYQLREQLPTVPPPQRQATLRAMRQLVKQELKLGRELLALAEADSRLGFHSEAEGYKYYPAKIAWRLRQLEKLLAEEFPSVEALARQDAPLFPEYAGIETQRRMPRPPLMRKWLANPRDRLCSEARPRRYLCQRFARTLRMDGRPWDGPWELTPLETAEGRHDASVTESPFGAPSWGATTWRAGHDERYLYVGVICMEMDVKGLTANRGDRNVIAYCGDDVVGLRIVTHRLWPAMQFVVNPAGHRGQHFYGVRVNKPPFAWQAAAWVGKDRWSATFRIDLRLLERAGGCRPPLRLDVIRCNQTPLETHHWIDQHPLQSRLALGTQNPANFGWLVLD